jgi:hypothetical protein
MSINRIPNEILSTIISLLEDDFTSLQNVTLTCKRFGECSRTSSRCWKTLSSHETLINYAVDSAFCCGLTNTWRDCSKHQRVRKLRFLYKPDMSLNEEGLLEPMETICERLHASALSTTSVALWPQLDQVSFDFVKESGMTNLEEWQRAVYDLDDLMGFALSLKAAYNPYSLSFGLSITRTSTSMSSSARRSASTHIKIDGQACNPWQSEILFHKISIVEVVSTGVLQRFSVSRDIQLHLPNHSCQDSRLLRSDPKMLALKQNKATIRASQHLLKDPKVPTTLHVVHPKQEAPGECAGLSVEQ